MSTTRHLRIAFLAMCGALLLGSGASTAGARVPADFFGVVSQGPKPSSRDFDRMRTGNVGRLRHILRWHDVQNERGPCRPGRFDPDGSSGARNVCDWSGFDPVVRGAAAEGVEVLPFVIGTPDFVSENDRVPPLDSREDREAWKEFLKAGVNRYGPGGALWTGTSGGEKPIKHWQIWNEPSSPTYFQPRPSPRKYAKLVKISDKAIADAEPRGKVVLAGLFATPRGSAGGSGGGIYLPKFLRRFYKVDGIKRHFDAAALHPFAPNLNGVKFQIKLARKKMRKAGDRRTKLWLTEIGWASDGPKKNQMVKSVAGQKRILKKAFRLFRKKRKEWRLGAVNWFSFRDTPPDSATSCHACPWTGLFRVDGTAKPSWRAFKKFT